MKFAAIRIQSEEFHVSWMCRLLQVSRSGYYAWLRRKPSRRERDDLRLSVKIVASFRANRGVYGSPRVVDELRADGESVGRRRVARIMREKGLCARLPRRSRKTTDSSHSRPVARDLVQRQFLPKTPNEVWAADITYIRTWEGWLYLAVVMDLFSRRVIGWAVANHLRRRARCLGASDGGASPTTTAWDGSSFGPWRAVREQRLPRVLATPRNRVQHESKGRLLGQCRRREFLRHAENRISLPTRSADSSAGAMGYRRLHHQFLTTRGDGTQRSGTSVPSSSNLDSWKQTGLHSQLVHQTGASSPDPKLPSGSLGSEGVSESFGCLL